MLEAEPGLVPGGGGGGVLITASFREGKEGKDLERRGGGLEGHLGCSKLRVGCSLGFLTPGRGVREAGVCTGMCAYERV